MVAVLVLAIALGILQLALAFHVRNTLTSCAAEGARTAAVDTSADGVARARGCAQAALGLDAEATADSVEAGGLPAVRITLAAPPSAFSLWRPGDIEVSARALVEGADDAP